VGASGAVFGVAAASIVWRWQRESRAEPRRATLEALGLGLGLVALNAASGGLQSAPVAWEAHLAGAGTGAVLAGLLRRRD